MCLYHSGLASIFLFSPFFDVFHWLVVKFEPIFICQYYKFVIHEIIYKCESKRYPLTVPKIYSFIWIPNVVTIEAALENKMAIWIIMIIMQKNKWINVVSLFSYLLESDPKFIHDLITTNCITNFYSFIQHWSSYLLTNNSPGLSLFLFNWQRKSAVTVSHHYYRGFFVVVLFFLLFCFGTKQC